MKRIGVLTFALALGAAAGAPPAGALSSVDTLFAISTDALEGFVAGVLEGNRATAALYYRRPLACPPPWTRPDRLSIVVLKHLRDKENATGKPGGGPAAASVLAALHSAYPCPLAGRSPAAGTLLDMAIEARRGFVVGVVEGHALSAGYFRRRRLICPRPTETPYSLALLVLNRLRADRALRAQPAADVVLRTLGRFFPCRGKPGNGAPKETDR